MSSLKTNFFKLISLGVAPELEDNKKLAIQIATFDAYWTLLTFIFYIFYSIHFQLQALLILELTGFCLIGFSIYLIYRRRYDAGRFLVHFTGLAGIFASADTVGVDTGYEFYYFLSVTIPFITFTMEEKKKGVFLSAVAMAVLLLQNRLGHGVFFEPVSSSADDKLISLIIVPTYIMAVFTVARSQINLSQKEVKRQLNELIHTSNLVALGEMTSGIAHEINNPLQSLTLQLEVLKRRLHKEAQLSEGISEHIKTIQTTTFKMAKMVKGLKSLSRNVTEDPDVIFNLSTVIEDIKSICTERMKGKEIAFEVSGDTDIQLKGNSTQLSQVIINLMNNSIEAISLETNKWVRLEIARAHAVCISVTDSGLNISEELSEKIMKPFFTTKEPSVGTGLGLSISRSLIEKWGGRLYHDLNSKFTRFVIELPLSRVRDDSTPDS